MKTQLGAGFSLFAETLSTEPPVSIRLNPDKPGYDASELAKVPWHPDGYYMPERPVFTLDPVFHAGGYYVQEASSMVLHEVLTQLVPSKYPLRILDLCAAPGGKSTLLASWMPPGSLLLANEVIRGRVNVLKDNLARWGHPDTFTCSYDPEAFSKLNGFFDVVLVDAPCSGEGLFRKDPDAVHEWSPEHVQLCSARQRRILSAAVKLVAPGGLLLYSTCTYNELENDQNAQWLVENQRLTHQPVNLPAEWGLSARNYGYQCYPHRLRGEGFYFAAFRQTRGVPFQGKAARYMDKLKSKSLHKREEAALADWLAEDSDFFFVQRPDDTVLGAPRELKEDLLFLDAALPQGVWLRELGLFKGKEFIPAQDLAMSTAIAPDLPALELNRDTALHFLKKENIVLSEAPKGWLLAQHQGLNLGWMKNLGNRVNNYLPKDWRIRMDIREI
ncbi:RNA methyltransferase [Cytophagaceae bacterium SJW1-29]|uniref:RNA methyltransferase n=2 Tax=Salmonirosea aquatica TaxID=2654236 RepID=A0A7C9BRF1_9BACT|nr:RNA methyltransferase [Cytophagaceae bacterium SJW1-29]